MSKGHLAPLSRMMSNAAKGQQRLYNYIAGRSALQTARNGQFEDRRVNANGRNRVTDDNFQVLQSSVSRKRAKIFTLATRRHLSCLPLHQLLCLDRVG